MRGLDCLKYMLCYAYDHHCNHCPSLLTTPAALGVIVDHPSSAARRCSGEGCRTWLRTLQQWEVLLRGHLGLQIMSVDLLQQQNLSKCIVGPPCCHLSS